MNKKQNIRISRKNEVVVFFTQTLRVAILIQKERWQKQRKTTKTRKSA